MTFRGASAIIGAYNLSLQAKQYSISQIWLQSGPPTELNIIQVGCGVHPTLYGDSALHLTASWTADGYVNTGCYDNLCPGFVQVNRDFGLGAFLKPTNPIGTFNKYAYVIHVKQDPSTGHWWLITTLNSIQVGYWPKEIFTHLSEGSSVIRYGGETFAPPDMVSPPMGSGRLPQELFKNSGFIGRLQITDSEYKETDVDPKDMKPYLDAKLDCYDLIYHGYEGPVYWQAFLYGGPGGQCDM
ncbi:hypothetical protein SESBI_03334 [Sesbania bispinosa]|nr:hypothetical protein SESBI_03334 [Sesbania bispinosa]